MLYDEVKEFKPKDRLHALTLGVYTDGRECLSWIPNPHAAFSSDIAKECGWPEEYVELIKYILCSANLAEYGTSPRGAWIHHGLAELMPKVIARWRADWTR